VSDWTRAGPDVRLVLAMAPARREPGPEDGGPVARILGGRGGGGRRPVVEHAVAAALPPAAVAYLGEALGRSKGDTRLRRRVARPGGVLAAWCYTRPSVTPGIDAAIGRLYSGVLEPYWPPERREVEAGYETIWFPFYEEASPGFLVVHNWDLGHLLGYLDTWAAVPPYREQNGTDPLDLIRVDLEAAWGDPNLQREVVWPLKLRVGRVG
jgi:hypothetical protein